MRIAYIPRRALKRHIEEQLVKQPELGRSLAETLNRLADEHFAPRWFVDFVGQKYREWDIYDAFALNSVLAMWRDGALAFRHLRLGSYPRKDAEVTSNQQAFGALAPNFRAVAVREQGRGASDDGTFEWIDSELFDAINVRLMVCSSQLPLEIGYTDPGRTLLHLLTDKGVARWPYGHDELVIGRAIEKRFVTPIRAAFRSVHDRAL